MHMRRRTLIPWLALACLALPLAACAGQPRAKATPTRQQATATREPAGNIYTDARLGFHVTLPPGWTATPYPGTTHTRQMTDVVFAERGHPTHRIEVGVIHGSAMPAAFAARGTAPARIGAYPAFVADTTLQQGRVPCLVRIFLAGTDYVIGEWCAMDASSHTAELEHVLATYQPASASFTPSAGAPSPPVPSCSQVRIAFGYKNDPGWGRTLAQTDATSPLGGWRGLSPGVAICSNTDSPDQYLFQCTELVNRFDAEQRGLPHLPGNAARYFDYYQDGKPHPGVVRDMPAGTYAYANDASQGTSAFAPAPGDLLVFQDVADPRVGWTSGLIHSPGHIAIITGVDATHVYVAQENFNDREAFMALPLRHTARGHAITDLSGLANRIVRGWIRLTA